MAQDSLIEMKNITKLYGKDKALNNISLTIPKNQVTALIGPNGAGKSTLIKILLSMIPQSSGEISYHKKLKFSYAPEATNLYPELNVSYFLSWIKKIKNISIEQLKLYIELFELKNHLDKKIQYLSKGYKRRLLIIQAISGRENFIILDEPTDGLDIEFKFKLRDILKSSLKKKTILICTHESIILNQLANKILILNKGEKIFEGNAKDLKSQDGKLYIEDIYMRVKK